MTIANWGSGPPSDQFDLALSDTSISFFSPEGERAMSDRISDSNTKQSWLLVSVRSGIK